MLTGRVLLLCLLAPAVAGACTGLKSATEISVTVSQPEAGAPTDPPSGDDDDTMTRNEPADAGTPPDDFSCERDYWVLGTKKRPECNARQVRVVSEAELLNPKGISIARTSTGRIGISFNYDQDAETTKLRVAHFTPDKADFEPPVVITRDSHDYQHVGYLSRIVASKPDTFHILSFDYEATSQLGSVNSQKLVDGKAPLTDPEPVLTEVPAPSEIGYAIDSSKTSYAVVRLAAASDKAKMLAFQKPTDGRWQGLPNLPNLGFGLLPLEAPAAGASSLFVDGNDRLHVLYHHNELRFASSPRYHVLAGSAWSYRKTVDNNVPDGWCGFSPKLAVFGPRKYALYFFNKATGGQTTALADLRLSTWVNEEDEPTHEIIDQQIPVTRPQSPRYRAAMAIDKYGLIHLAIARPSTNEEMGYIEYRRQERVVGGGTRWVSDIVDDDAFSFATGAEVDILVDDNARPHIAYVSGKDRKVHYATRFDR